MLRRRTVESVADHLEKLIHALSERVPYADDRAICCELAPHIAGDCMGCVSGRSLPESSTAEMAAVGRRRPYTIPRSGINH
jgi:hypothetical protein